jgi:DNA-binding beta-propeller fold protein YncE
MNHNTVSTIAGSRANSHQDGEGNVAKFSNPLGVAVDEDGNVIVADTDNHRICKITPQGHVSTLAGTGDEGYEDGEGIMAQFNGPRGVAVDGGGNVVVADWGNERIRKITPQGQVTTLAGTGEWGYRDGEGTVAQFYSPSGVAVDGGGNVIVAETDNHRIRKITAQGHVITVAGTGEEGHREMEKGRLLSFLHPVESQWMGAATSSWLTSLTIVFARSHHRV